MRARRSAAAGAARRAGRGLSTSPQAPSAPASSGATATPAPAAAPAPSVVLFCGKEFASSTSRVRALLRAAPDAARARVEVRDAAMGAEVAAALRGGAEVAVPLMSRLTADAIRAAPRLRLIQQWGSGLEGVDVDAATRRGILVANTPTTLDTARATAEIALSLLLTSLRGTGPNAAAQRGWEWGGPRGRSLYSKTVGVYGARGKIGAALSQMLRGGFGCRVVELVDKSASLAAQVARLDEPLDALVLATPLTPHTAKAANADALDALFRLNPEAHLVNVGRGGLVDRDALEAALARGRLAGFATDVWFTEPPAREDPLLAHPRVVWTNHVGGVCDPAATANDENCAAGILDFLVHGRTPEFAVNAHLLNAGAVGSVAPAAAAAAPPKQAHAGSKPNEGGGAVVDAATVRGLRPTSRALSRLMDELRAAGVALSTRPADLAAHAKDESLHPADHPPDVVVFPESTAQVAAVMRACHRLVVPVVPFGAGTSLEGGVACLAGGGVSLDLSRMRKVLEVRDEDWFARVEAGVTRKQLNESLRDRGLMFPVDPGADATLGGMASTRASGTTAVEHGTMRERVAGLTVVLPDGRVIRTGGTYVKSSAGYDLTSLFVGSEGTLGVVTEVLLRLVPIPEATVACVASFATLHDAVNTVVDLKRNSVPVSRAELLDQVTMRAVRAAGLQGYEEAPTLFLEFSGSPAAVQESARAARELAAERRVRSFREAAEAGERAALWRARHNAYYSVLKLRPPGSRGWPTDVCVPISQLAQCILETAADVEAQGLTAPTFGHVADGNFHTILIYNEEADGPQGLQKLVDLNNRIVERALRAGGTVTGEHGVGFGKRAWLQVQHGEAVHVMRDLKRALDPQGLMNPGKVV